MVYIANLTNAQALACAEAMQKRGRFVLCNQILAQLEARVEATRQKRKPRTRKRNAKTGELA